MKKSAQKESNEKRFIFMRYRQIRISYPDDTMHEEMREEKEEDDEKFLSFS